MALRFWAEKKKKKIISLKHVNLYELIEKANTIVTDKTFRNVTFL